MIERNLVKNSRMGVWSPPLQRTGMKMPEPLNFTTGESVRKMTNSILLGSLDVHDPLSGQGIPGIPSKLVQ